MRYIAVGSEDRSVYLYDLRTGTSAARLLAHTDAAPAVAFNPMYPQLATGGFDGRCRFFSCE